MRPHLPPTDRQVVALEDELLVIWAHRGPRQVLEHHAGDRCRDRTGTVGRERCGRSAPHLRGDRRPRGVVVDVCVLDALQARSGTGDHERSDPDAAVTDDDGDVRRPTAGPRRPQRGVDHVLGDDDGHRRFGIRQLDRTAARGNGPDHGHTVTREEVVDDPGEVGGAVHLHPGERFGEHVEHGGGGRAEHPRSDLRSAPDARGDAGQGVPSGLTAEGA